MAVLERRQGMKPLCWELVLLPLLLGQPFRPTAPWAELERWTARAQTGGLGGPLPGCWESLHKTSSPAPAFGDFCRALAASFVKLEGYMTASGPRSSPRFQILWFYLLKKYCFLSFTLIEILNGGKKKCMAMFWAPRGEWCKQNHTRVQLPSSDVCGATHSESSSCRASPALQQESDEDFSTAIFLVSCP